ATTAAGLITTEPRFLFCIGLAGRSPSRPRTRLARPSVLLMPLASGVTASYRPSTTRMTLTPSVGYPALTCRELSQFMEFGNSRSSLTKTWSPVLFLADGSGQVLHRCRRVIRSPSLTAITVQPGIAEAA